uniref:DNA-directed RNA polymerase subunit beta'' n=1 Tax=Ophidocladus simpliciusculus TaxID=1261574 RepID=A0A1Z1MJG9_9FLOR|nr:RNA polymerase b''''-subunit [Ophidocladus simpliciusculus]ARW65992.1 RNA polymerase b''''-subunit [Ophidocladus simpliciusculus]
MKNDSSPMYFFNKVIDKSELKKLITWAFRNYGIARASNLVDQLKDLGFYYSTKGGISLSLEDLRIPPGKQKLLNLTISSIQETNNRYDRGEITIVERFQKVIDTWNYASENLKKEVIEYFKNTDPLNSIYMMAFSGARANISQVKQLVGMRGLMADPQGQIIDLPIFHNFREGLTITDYFISSYGARKGLVDTALRTADSGYLTRRLVDVAQYVIVREYNCKTSKGVLLEEMIDNQKTLISLKQSLLGRVLAENIVDNSLNLIIAKANQSIDSILAEKIFNLGIKKVLVRSALTCSSLNSVCQLCYGWNLAHGQLVDLGEAVGIIAAQSIGEPGTQLTMRTFHTGGVFTGELSQNIVSDTDGLVQYPKNLILSKTRNRYGDDVLLVNNDCNITISSTNEKQKNIPILKGSLLFFGNNQAIKTGQIIAEYPLNNKFSTEKAQKAVIASFSGNVYFDNFAIDFNLLNSSLNKSLVVWVLAGEVYNLPKHANLMIANNQIIKKSSLLARTQLLSHHDGKIYIIQNKEEYSKLLLVTSSKLYTNLKVFVDQTNDYKKYILQTESNDRFILNCQFNKRIVDQQIIADLISSIYKTKTGGIIKYLDLSISRNTQEEFYNVHGFGYILWIPEETHIINKDASLLLATKKSFTEAGTEIIQNIFANNSGFLEVLEKDGIIREVVIKPGQLVEINLSNHNLEKFRGFLRPGEILLNQINTNKLVYWEYISINNLNFILLRPVIIYSVPQKNLLLRFSDNSFSTNVVNLKLVRRTYFKDGERVKSVNSVNLLSTHLIVELQNNSTSLKCYIQYYTNNQNIKNEYLLIKFITVDFLTIKDSYFNKNHSLYTKTSILVSDGQYIKSNSVISKTDIFSSISGRIAYIDETKTTNRRILIISQSNTYAFNINHSQKIMVKVNSWVYTGDEIASNLFSSCSGRVIEIENNKIIIRLGQPYLISSGSFLHIENGSLIQRGESIATLIFERLKTGDIVQGLPRIEEILEARKKIGISFNPHTILEVKFRSYLSQGLSIYNATRLSFLEIQLLLVKEVQSVYQSQGVYIADKHIEVIVRQMTSKVKVESGGDTEYLPGELVELQKIESLNKSLLLTQKDTALYYPILLGITKASLNTDSFISAASFQETTKVLTEAAIYGKLDWLRGLKENVIIGRLIPAGTGFNAYNSKKIHQNIYSKISCLNTLNNSHSNLNKLSKDNYFNDIIIDDRIARNNII